MNERLGGDGMTALWQSDAAQYNMLKPRFNATIARTDAAQTFTGNNVFTNRTNFPEKVMIGSSSASSYTEHRLGINHNGSTGVAIFDDTATAGAIHVQFVSSGHILGTITNNANSTTSYNASSDERLKNFDVQDRDFGAMIDAIIVKDAEWLSAPGDRVLAVSAQQLAASGYAEGVQYPDKVSVVVTDKNGKAVLDKDGNPQYRMQTDEEAEGNLWSVEYGRLGILALWAAKNLRQRVSQLEAEHETILARLAALEGN